jgi:5-methylcytosine-specific restriction protein A
LPGAGDARPLRAACAGATGRRPRAAEASGSAPRGRAAPRYDHRWRKARARFLQEHPLCAACERQGRVTAAAVVDHIVPHRGDQALFWDERNWQPMCRKCHDRKTFAQDTRRLSRATRECG